MAKFPLIFEVSGEATDKIGESWHTKGSKLPAISCCVPPEFGGPGGTYTPEDFFAMAVINCILATFKVYCDKTRLGFAKIKATAQLTLDHDQSTEQLGFSNIKMSFEITAPTDQTKVVKLLAQAVQKCPISSSIKTAKTMQISVV
jgi:organic hydroperoxide reductase OsmC/OhrA